MPTTKKEEAIFGLMMCFGMVVFMMTYNLIRHDALGSMNAVEFLLQLILCFVVAFLLEAFVVGPVAKKVAFSLPYDKSKKLYVIVSLALCMVLGMVTLMSLYGLLTNGLNGEPFFRSYFTLYFYNFIFALPLQLLIVGPTVRFVFGKWVKNRGAVGAVS
ncbi:hypothetical protein HUB94_16735 [Paenibacillus cellulosilyticus]|uniref:hypothetical protein n=1 Tax=Paenibacillus cellulosilyticus TaxID=375489 RepID=UPI000D70D2FE|nr:hypothetical protein [Paenibacillus cellulosilyticus]QKS46595.1 hypothetical protein HUB94_16735 [Paenibacillus cellulosilyticus]